ncbi:hypothetical protein WKH32_02515 [Pantoea agglomerans]|uniref:hypothetical protein n=1 Tax=Enterobacter agglomerans TaxID=549 RepID=UPI003C79E88C
MLWAAKKQCAEMVRGKRGDGPKSNPVHFDFRDDALMTFVEKLTRCLKFSDWGYKKARKAFTLRAFRTSMMVLVTINQEFGGLAESE